MNYNNSIILYYFPQHIMANCNPIKNHKNAFSFNVFIQEHKSGYKRVCQLSELLLTNLETKGRSEQKAVFKDTQYRTK